MTFRVRNDAPEEVHIHGYNIKKELEANKTETVSFKASITGIFEIQLEYSATQLAELRVDTPQGQPSSARSSRDS